MYKKNIIMFLFLCVLHTECMFQRATYYAAKYIPAILKRFNVSKATPAVPAGHVISNIDGSPVSQTQFNDIKNEILRPNEFPTALKNPDYNPDADETKVIQQKLDKKYANDVYTQRLYDPFHDHPVTDFKKTTVSWIPQTLHDLFTYKHSENEHDEYKVNQAIHDYLLKNPKKINESDVKYYQRLAKPLIAPTYIKMFNRKSTKDWLADQIEAIEKSVSNSIEIEADQHKQDPRKILLYRGNCSANDFKSKDCYDVGKNEVNSSYAKKMAKTPDYWGTPIALSYGLSLLSNAKPLRDECPFKFAFGYTYYNHDLQVLPVDKKEFINPDGLWYVNPDFDYHQSMYEKGFYFHPRAKGHATACQIEKFGYHNQIFPKNDPRFVLHETKQEAFKKYAKLKKYQIKHAIGLTPFTKGMIQKAQKAYQKGKVSKIKVNQNNQEE